MKIPEAQGDHRGDHHEGGPVHPGEPSRQKADPRGQHQRRAERHLHGHRGEGALRGREHVGEIQNQRVARNRSQRRHQRMAVFKQLGRQEPGLRGHDQNRQPRTAHAERGQRT